MTAETCLPNPPANGILAKQYQTNGIYAKADDAFLDARIHDVHVEHGQTNGAYAKVDDAFLDARVHEVRVEQANGEKIVILRQRGNFIQASLDADSTEPSSLETFRRLTPESLVRILDWTNDDRQHENGEGTSFNKAIRVRRLALLSEAKADIVSNPVLHGAPGEKASQLDTSSAFLNQRLDNRILDVRVAATAAIFKVSSAVHELAVAYFAASDFAFVPTPTLIHYDFPGEEGTQFELPYFDKAAWLTQTGEVHLGMALSADLERVYDIHTVFRREEEIDARHLTEFTMIEAVFALKDDWAEILDFAEKLVISLSRSLQKCEKYRALTEVAQQLYPLATAFKLGLTPEGKLIQLKFSEAKKILRDSIGIQSASDEEDLTTEEEAALGRFLASDQSHLGPPTDIFVITQFPKNLRSFSIRPIKEDETESSSFDIIMRGQEIVTGCELLNGYRELRTAMTTRKHPIDPDCPAWRPYVEAHEIGMPPWGGFGLGLNRFVQGFLGLTDIRETVLFPRDSARLRP